MAVALGLRLRKRQRGGPPGRFPARLSPPPPSTALSFGVLPQASLWFGCLAHGPWPGPRPRSPRSSWACVLTLTRSRPGLNLFGHVAYAVSVGYHPGAAECSPVARELPLMSVEAVCFDQ